MKKLIKISLISILLASTLSAKSVYNYEYQMHSNIYNKSINISNASQREIFFGSKLEYYEEVAEGLKEIQSKGLEVALESGLNQSANIAKGFLEAAGKGVAVGAVIGGIFGAIDSYIKDKRKASEYMYVVEFTTSSGEKTTGSVLLSSQSKDFKEEPKLDKIKKIMKGGF
ncbi:hypothetical protein [Poseidonibacter ostreae]|uniref:Glycine zipper family protein n=1 Tax=Poseidonibacter ostreae TaxID=2654171 RepID=A0A6L4WTU6_9BACT|nr:hypothetical protein [Poseidonibacter ostreae]KAB7889570.1 hypothetical protein GBG19_05805 [Poseidonibacter ostreae]